ncbi:hypothetical protein NQZ68_033001 [Dissostichus eleginoides]|nr:hypothetical protein NQZ68_033001 [Dissostichus eleginoides]
MLICVRLSVPSNASIRFCSDTEEAKLVSPDQIPGGLHSVTQGDTSRGSPLPVAYRGDHRPVTVCHSGFVPSCPHAGRLSEKGRPVMSSDRLTGDR